MSLRRKTIANYFSRYHSATELFASTRYVCVCDYKYLLHYVDGKYNQPRVHSTVAGQR